MKPGACLRVWISCPRRGNTQAFGYALNRKLAVRGLGDWQHTFNGLHFPAVLTTPELELTHERLLKANYWHVGGGASYSITPKTDVSVDVVTFGPGNGLGDIYRNEAGALHLKH